MAKLQISVYQILNTYKQIFYTVVSILIVTLFTPFLLLFCIPIYCFRFVIVLLAKIVRPDLDEILEARSTGMGTEDIHKSPNSTLLITMTLEGSFTKEYMIDRMEKILTIKRENGKLKYKQLYEYLTTWMGFFFWTQDKHFDVKNHIKNITLNEKGKIIENTTELFPEVDVYQLKQIEKQLIQTSYISKRSPWDMSIIKNFKPKFAKEGVEYHALMFRVHHSITDGYGILKMLLLDVCEQDPREIQFAEFPKKSSLAQGLLNIYSAIRAPFDIMSHLLWAPDQNAWRLPSQQLCGNANFHMAESDLIPLEYLKNIKTRYGVQFKTVVFAACTSAIRNAMLKRGVAIPKSITSMVPFPFPGHPNKLGNYWSAMTVNFPVGLPDPHQRLMCIKKNMDDLRHSTAAMTAFKIQPLIGGLFHWMVKPLAKLAHPTALSSDFPGPVKQAGTDSFAMVDAHFIGGFPRGNVGLLLFSTSYNGNWKINVMVDHGLMSSDAEVEELLGYVVKDLSNMHSETQV